MIDLLPDRCRQAIEDSDTPGLVLLVIAMHAFKDDLLGDPEQNIEPMDPVEIWQGLYDIYGGWVTEEGENRLNALLLALRGDFFYQDVEVFRAVCSALVDGDIADSIAGEFDEVSALDIAWAITEVELARNVEEPEDFSRSVREFIDSVVSDEQEEQEETLNELRDLYDDCMARLLAIGVTANEIRLLDDDYAQAIRAMEQIHAQQ